MNEKQTRPKLNRRRFLALLAAGGVTAAGGYALLEYAPWLDYNGQADQNRNPFEPLAAVPVHLRELVRYATLAANGHNTQPWKFAVLEDAIEIHPDYSRRLPVVDPDDREMWISLGCALENLLIAAHAAGYVPEVTYPNADDFIRVDLAAGAPQQSSLFDAIPLRQNTRSDYDGQLIPNADLDELQALALEPGISLRFVTNPTDMSIVIDYVNQGTLSQYADRAFLDELIGWLRFTQREALETLDGLFTRCTGNPEVPRWLGQMFVAGIDPRQQVDSDTSRLRTSPGAVVVASETEDKSAWVRTGQVYERLALTMTALNIKSAFLNQPLEVPQVRGQFQSALGLGEAMPQLLLRFGYANTMPRSLRRPVEQVLI